MQSLFMGVDIGTSGVRALLFDRDGFAVSSGHVSYDLKQSYGRAELDMDIVFDSFTACIRQCVKNAKEPVIEGIGLSSQMHSLIVTGDNGENYTPLITWADTRALEQADRIGRRDDGEELYHITGCRVQHPMYPLSKILWLKEKGNLITGRKIKYLTVKEYIVHRLFGEYVVDYTLASSQGYFDIHSRTWSKKICEDILGIQADELSVPVECTYKLTGLDKGYANEMGIDPNTPFVIGSGDGIMANIGSGVVDSKSFSSTIGTSGAVRTTVKRPFLDKDGGTWCYSFTDDSWVTGGAINNGGIVLKWLAKRMGAQILADTGLEKGSEYKAMDVLVRDISPGSEGLIFLPYLTGERSPDWDSTVRGMMWGLDFSHTNGHIIRAAMEGIMFRMYSVYKIMDRVNHDGDHIRASGGYAKSEPWLQMQADLFGKEIVIPHSSEGSALGAAYTAMVSLGAVADFTTGLKAMEAKKRVSPNWDRYHKYQGIYQKAMELYNQRGEI